jgi:hypothetical protein
VGTRRKEALRGTLAVLALVLVSAPAVIAAPGNRSQQLTEDGAGLLGSAEPPPDPRNLPGKQENLEVVGRLQIPGVRLGQIADVSVHKGFAYLNSWDDPLCRDGGTYVVDIRTPSSPRLVTFIPADQPYYHGEGAHALSINTPGFQGDILAVNNETYGSNVGLEETPTGFTCLPSDRENPAQGTVNVSGGGFDLYDVSNPANPVPLVRNAGDRDEDNEGPEPPNPFAWSYHSVFVWQDGPRAFLVASDNIEDTDVDIFDITNPRAPVLVGDHALAERFPQILDGEQGFGETVLHHDVVVKQIGGRPIMKADYWDAGYVQMDVSDPANPRYINDTRYSGEDPLFPGSGLTPEGNGHQGEFSFDNQFLLAADEDFGPFRALVDIVGDGTFNAAEATDTEARIEDLPDGSLGPSTTFVGRACAATGGDTVPAAPADDGDADTDDIAVIVRGLCSFEEKVNSVKAAGWDGWIIYNNPGRPDGDPIVTNGVVVSGGDLPGVFARRRDVLPGLFGRTDNTDPPVPTDGSDVSISTRFDGWGYAHLYDARTAERIDSYAIDEALDPRFASGFGDLSIHEFATDPTEPLAYSSYYAGGIRVFQFSRQTGLNETGAWIADAGSNFWGVEQFTTAGGERLIAGSDRDFGLVILRYTGPGAARPPACSDITVMVPYRQSANVPLNCSDANNNPLRQSRLSEPQGGTVTDRPPAGGWTYQHTGDRLGPAGSFGFKANDGAADSNTATASLVAVARNGGRCFNPFVGSSAGDVIIGSPFGDRIDGRRGRDLIRARAGADCVKGGTAGDRLSGAGGRDRLSGGRGADKLFGGQGRDRMSGGAGNDGLSGRSGRDRIVGGRGPDRLNGGGGNDRIGAGGGTNRLSGGRGNDRLSAANGRVDMILCGSGTDRVRADADDNVADDCERVNRQ